MRSLKRLFDKAAVEVSLLGMIASLFILFKFSNIGLYFNESGYLNSLIAMKSSNHTLIYGIASVLTGALLIITILDTYFKISHSKKIDSLKNDLRNQIQKHDLRTQRT